MNERIRELAEQAEILITEVGAFHNTPQGAYQLQEQHMKRFAELIVRDTLDQVAEFNRLTKAYQTQGIDPEIDVTREVLRNYGFTRFPRS
jgi:hypothetical protein